MKVFFSCSSKVNIDRKYIEAASDIAAEVSEDNDLIIGCAMEEGMAGAIIKQFKNNNREINVKTLKLYNENPDSFPYTTFSFYEDTFDRTKNIYKDSDILLILPGGTGTLSELLAFIEDHRTLDNDKDIIIFNQDGYYDDFLNIVERNVNDKFNSESTLQEFIVFTKIEEITNYFRNN